MRYEPVLHCGCDPESRQLCPTGLGYYREFDSTGDQAELEQLAKHLRTDVRTVRGLVAPSRSTTRIP